MKTHGNPELVRVDRDRPLNAQVGQLVDEVEFAEHQVRYGDPAEVIRQAEESADWLLATVRARTEPFGTGYRRWLDLISEEGDGTAVPAAAADEEQAVDAEPSSGGPVPTASAD